MFSVVIAAILPASKKEPADILFIYAKTRIKRDFTIVLMTAF